MPTLRYCRGIECSDVKLNPGSGKIDSQPVNQAAALRRFIQLDGSVDNAIKNRGCGVWSPAVPQTKTTADQTQHEDDCHYREPFAVTGRLPPSQGWLLSAPSPLPFDY